MITIRSPEDVVKSKLPPNLARYVTSIMNGILRAIPDYNAEDDGDIIVVTPSDTDEKLCKVIGSKYADNVWEGITYNTEFRCYHAVLLANNQFAKSVIIPCESWLDSTIRQRMVSQMA